jgi:hypothetical protein
MKKKRIADRCRESTHASFLLTTITVLVPTLLAFSNTFTLLETICHVVVVVLGEDSAAVEAAKVEAVVAPRSAVPRYFYSCTSLNVC